MCRPSIFFVILILMSSPFLLGQAYLVHHYSETEGMVSSNVYGLCQDKQGRMWFATRAGISRYDGVEWKNYTVSDGLPTPAFRKILTGPGGRVWALSASAYNSINVVYMETGDTGMGKWQSLPPIKTNMTTLGISSFLVIPAPMEEENTLQVQVLVGTTMRGIFLWRGGSWKQLDQESGHLPTKIVNGIAALNGKVYIATDQGLTIYQPGNTPGFRHLNATETGLPGNQIRDICVESNGKFPDHKLKKSRLWLMDTEWLAYMEEGEERVKEIFPVPPQLRLKHLLVSMSPDYRGGIYVSIMYQLLYFNYRTGNWSRMGMQNGLISEGANDIYVDFEKNIWLANDRGVSKISSRRFSNYNMSNGLLEDEVASILEYDTDSFVLGHNKGVTFMDNGQFTPHSFKEKLGDRYAVCRVMEMSKDSRGNIWLALSGAGLGLIDKQRRFRLVLPEQRWLSEVNSLFLDGNQNLWITEAQGLLTMDTRRQVLALMHPIGKEENNKSFRRIFGDENGLHSIASYKYGIYLKDGQSGKWKNFQAEDSSNANNTYAVFHDSRGRTLVGTLDGLYRLNRKEKKLERFRSGDFEVIRPVYFIIEDTLRRLWFGTDNGVIRWQGTGSAYSHFSTPHGLVGLETNRAAGLVDSRGKIWIGTNRGLSIYDDQFDENSAWTPPPKVRLVSVETNLGNFTLKNRSPDSVIRLKPETHTLTFHFRGISLRNEQSVRFNYKLEGFDSQWLKEQVPYKQMVRYPNLFPGHYRFRFKARNAANVWSKAVVSPEIIIPWPFYRRWWFYLLTVLALAAIFYGAYRLVTARRRGAILEQQVEERTHQLQDVEKRYNKLFEESKDAVFIVSPDGGVIDMNPAGLELLGGFPLLEEMSEKHHNLRLTTPAGEWNHLRLTIERKGFIKDYQLNLERRDGDKATVLMTANVVRGKNGMITAYRGIMRDISEQKRLERQLMQAQKMEAIGTLAGGIAHDFNNILGVILGYSELVIDDLQEDSLIRKNAEQIMTAARRASELVKQILAFSRQSERKRSPMDILPVIKEALKLLRSSLPATIEIRRHFRVESAIVEADSTQIHQVMMNLCTNAAHAMKKKGGLLDVSLDHVFLDPEEVTKHHDIAPGGYYQLTVGDTGHGIPRVVMKRIFDPYFTTKDTGEGTGMGLAVVHGIVKSYGGDISLISEPDKGASVHVFLPACDEKDQTGSSIQYFDSVPGGNERILLIDDENALIEVGKQTLERLGYNVQGKSDALEAITAFKKNPQGFDLVITDLTMPKMTGLEIAKKVKRIKPGTPVILCSGFSAAASQKDIENTVDDFVMKPIIKGKIAHAIRTLLDNTKKRA